VQIAQVLSGLPHHGKLKRVTRFEDGALDT
jgi:hypothetical protein